MRRNRSRKRGRAGLPLIWAVCLAVIVVGGGFLAIHALLQKTGGDQAHHDALDALPTQGVEETLPPEPTEADRVRAIVFTDVSVAAPYHDAVCYAAHMGYLVGAGDGTFDPEGLATNDMAATALDCLMGEDELLWEYMTSPDTVTRRMLAHLLTSAAVQLGLDITATGNIESYSDKYMVVSEAYDIMSRAAEKGLFDGIITNKLHPELAISRAQLAQALLNLDALRPEGDLARELRGTPASMEAVALSQETLRGLQAAVDLSVKRNRAVGAQVAIIQGGDVIATLNSGWATKNTDEMSDDNKMRVASLSKVAVGMGVMALAEDGTVDLDVPIGQYWDTPFVNPNYPDDPVTMRNILNHTSSIWPAGDDTSRAYAQVKALLSSKGGYTNTKPGDISSWYYNNYAFSVLGQTAELAVGKTMDDIMDEQFFHALGIDAAFEAGEVDTPDTLTTLYREDGTPWRTAAELGTVVLADPAPGANGRYFAGGFTISAGDLGKLVSILANDGAYQGLRFLRPETVAAMEDCSEGLVNEGEHYQAYPLDYRADMYGREGIYFHNGNAYGAFTCASYDPLTGDGAVVLITGSTPAKIDGVYAACSDINAAIYPALAGGGGKQ